MLVTRAVAPADLDLICRHREEMFREAGRSDASLAAMAAPFRRWLAERLADGRYFGFVVEADGIPVAAVGLMEINWPPHPAHPVDDRRGYLLNLFVEPTHRRHGIASDLLVTSEREFVRRGIGFVVLHATDMGRPLYEQIGWKSTTEMAKALPRSP
jgi:ribosomal protein S18 acetylase RimI-like enzyme